MYMYIYCIRLCLIYLSWRSSLSLSLLPSADAGAFLCGVAPYPGIQKKS